MQLFTNRLLPALVTTTFILLPVAAHAATYNSQTNELALSHLVDGSRTLIDVVLKLNSDGTYSIQSSTESAFPIFCPGSFSETTFSLIKQAKSADEINTLLGCRWSQQQKSLFEFTGNTSQSSHAFSWLDSACQTLSVVVKDTTGQVELSTLSKNKAGCNVFSAFYPYDTKKKILSFQYVKIDDTAIASEAYIKLYNLNGINRYEVISYEITPNTNLPVVCNLITEADYEAISLSMTPDEISNRLGCQGSESISDPDHTGISYLWRDHEWNSIEFREGSKVFLQFRIGNTPN